MNTNPLEEIETYYAELHDLLSAPKPGDVDWIMRVSAKTAKLESAVRSHVLLGERGVSAFLWAVQPLAVPDAVKDLSDVKE